MEVECTSTDFRGNVMCSWKSLPTPKFHGSHTDFHDYFHGSHRASTDTTKEVLPWKLLSLPL